MPKRTSKSGSELFIVDNSDTDWKVLRYLHDWCPLSQAIDIASGYFEIGALLGLKDEWPKVDRIRILMGDEVTKRTKAALTEGLARRLDASLEAEKQRNDFLVYAKALHELHRRQELTDQEWFNHQSRVYPILDQYQKDGFHQLLRIAKRRLRGCSSSINNCCGNTPAWPTV